MKWKPIGSCAIESDCKTFRISKAIIGDMTRYTLFRNGDMIETFDTSDAAKREAERKEIECD